MFGPRLVKGLIKGFASHRRTRHLCRGQQRERMMTRLTVTGMTCQHCVAAVTRALRAVPGVTGVRVDLPSGRVEVEGSAAPALLRAAIMDEGYGIATD